jgi:FKBP-type peptidyl-prolyl cis-trans isomerase FklB
MSDEKITGELEKFSYALGMSIAGNLIKSGVNTINPEQFLVGIKDTFSGEMPKIMPDEANKILEEFISKANQGQSNNNLEKGVNFLDKNRNKEGVTELPSGLQYKVLKEGEGELPVLTDQVKCHYHGTLIDGTVFDSSVERGQPAVFPVNGVIQGWVEALQLMSTGSTWRLFIPPELAYGEQGAGGVIGPNTTLVFDVELLEIV